MEQTTFTQVQQLVDQLNPLDQARLLAYLVPRLTSLVSSIYPPLPTHEESKTTSWEEFFQVGDSLIANDTPETETLTQTLALMRR